MAARDPPATPGLFEGRGEFSSGRTAVRIASVAALGGLLFSYDSAVINGAVASFKHFGINNTSLSFLPSPQRCSAHRHGAMTASRLADRIGRISVMKIAAVLFLISALGTGLAGSVWMIVLFPHRRRRQCRRRLGDRAGLHRRDLPARIRGRLGSSATTRHRHQHLHLAGHRLPAGSPRRQLDTGPVAGPRGGWMMFLMMAVPAVVYGL